ALRWAEVCADPTLRDLPYKIELNAYGTIEMSPANNRHARLQGTIAHELARQLPQGGVLTECPILTDIGVRVPDVAWASNAFLARHGETTPFPQAPEICVEIRSPSNADEEMSMKVRAFLTAGAHEVWVVSEDGEVAIYDASGARDKSRYPVVLTLPPRQSR
ncbi:MAG: Uma2 family endonuclease, partial [Burkholderiaceae bacterium]|nr:Uma2 family endonuclease [Burkholderiaceae bacterium]